jgi:pyridoxal phosphate enzyme (YggS family)
MPTVAENIAAIKAKIATHSKATEIIAVSKNHPADAVREAIAAGQFLFGENRVQEAGGKFPELKKQFPQIKLHLIGPLQTNKVKDALALFDVIQTLDREKLALEVAKQQTKQLSNVATQQLFIQVNVGQEPQKAGIAPQQAHDFYKFCTQDLTLNVTGLMCIPPANEDPTPYFEQLINLKSKILNLKYLSMGMSADYETAAKLGANYVRIGTAIFGARADL